MFPLFPLGQIVATRGPGCVRQGRAVFAALFGPLDSASLMLRRRRCGRHSLHMYHSSQAVRRRPPTRSMTRATSATRSSR
jgi:hypothetical protein